MLYRIFALTMFVPLAALAQNQPPDPMSLPTRDAHQNLTIVADPYIAADRYKGVFGKKSPYDAGIIGIQVYFRNDNDLPIRLYPDTVELIVSQPGQERQRLGALSPEEVANRSLLNTHISGRPPFPWPGSLAGSGHNKDWTEMVNSLQSVALGTDVFPPHATTHGFLFFDLNHEFNAIRYAHLYIPDLVFMTDKKALFFFEIDLSTAPSK
jgi:hypothetical protein